MESDGSRPASAGGGHRPSPVPVIHAVTDDLILTRDGFIERALGVMQALGSRGAVHLRARVVPARRLMALAEALRLAQQDTECWLIVNDRIDIALSAGAAGAQLTSRSMRMDDARRIAPALAIGASVHTVEHARAAALQGADWVVAGHIFRSASHEGVPARGIGFLMAVRDAAACPVLAIGGVTPERTRELRRAGAYGVAAIRGIWGQRDAERAAKDYLTAYDADDGAARDLGHRER